MAGKNRANTLAAILGNMEDLEGAYNDALKAEGSALRENAAYLDSIQGRVDLFNNAMQTMWMNFIDTGVAKGLVNIGTALIQFIDKVGLLPSVAGAFALVKGSISGIKTEFEALNNSTSSVSNVFKKTSDEVVNSVQKEVSATKVKVKVKKQGAQADKEAAVAKQMENTETIKGAALDGISAGAKKTETKATWGQVAAEKALAAAKGLAKGLLIGAATFAITAVITKVAESIMDASRAMDELTDSAITTGNQLSDARDTMEDYKEEVTELREVLEDSNTTEQEAYDARARLIEIQNDLVDSYGKEAENINLVTGAIETQIAKLDELSRAKAAAWFLETDDKGNSNQKAYDEAKKTIAEKHNVDNKLLLSSLQEYYTSEYDSATGTYINKPLTSMRLGGASGLTTTQWNAFYSGFLDVAKKFGGVGDTVEYNDSTSDTPSKTTKYFVDFENKTVDELEEIAIALDAYVKQFEREKGVSLTGVSQEIAKAIGSYDTEEYKKAVELYNIGRQNEAISTYSNEYGSILDSEGKINRAKTDAERLSAINEYEYAVDKAIAAAEKANNQPMVDYFTELQNKFAQEEFELRIKVNDDGLGTEIQNIINDAGEQGLSALDNTQMHDLANRYQNGEFKVGPEGTYVDYSRYTKEQVSGMAALKEQADAADMSVTSLIDILTNLGYITGRPIEFEESIEAVSEAYTKLASTVESYISINDILNEATYDNIKLSQEQGDALKELIGSEEEYADCIDESNGYIVKNSSLLRKLVAQKKQEQKATISVAKSNSQLQYKNTVQQLQHVIKAMALEVKATGVVSHATLNTIGVLRSQLTTLKQTIQQYALLELQLTDAANAYSEFEAAKARDAQLTYGDSMIEMLQTINEGFKTGKVGTEAFQFAVEAIVPPEVYQGIDDVETRMIAIHDYIDKNPLFADWFTIDDGEFSITLDNINNFIDDAFNAGLFTHDSSGEFFLNSNFISDSDKEQINSLNETLKEFQNTYNGTVDLVNRKRIDITEDNINTVHGWGMNDVEVGDYMTVASQTYDDGNVAIVVTPILPNGELMEQDELDAYVDDVIAKANAGSGNYSDYDTKGILMGVFDDADTWEENLAASDEFVNRVHEIHEVINSLGDSATLKDFADALGVTESAALAMLTELEKYDASWGNIISDLTTTPLDRKITEATDALDEALAAQEEFIRSGGDLNSEEYQKLVDNVNSAQTALNDATKAAELNAQKYNQIETAYAALTGEITLTKEAAEGLFKSLGFVNDYGECTVQVDDNGTIHITEEQLNSLKSKADEITSKPTMMDMQLRYDAIDAQIAELQRYIDEDLNFKDSEVAVTLGITNEEEAKAKVAELTAEQETISLNYNITATTAEQSAGTLEKLTTWETNGLNINISGNTEKLQSAVQEANAIEPEDKDVDITADPTQANADIDSVDDNKIEDKKPSIIIQGVPVAIDEIDSVADELKKLTNKSVNISVNKTTYEQTKKWNSNTQQWETAGVNGTAHVGGTANASGDWGAPKTEMALTGELGPEMIVRGNRWFTVGDHGAEFTQVKKGDIIFNHKQTEDLLSKGYVTSRGKMTGGAFASGTAYYKTFDGYVGDEDVFEDGSDKWMDPWTNTIDSISDAADSISDAADEFREIFDWIEVRLEEIDETLGLLESTLENAIYYTEKNSIIDSMIDVNNKKLENLKAGYDEYAEYAEKLLAEVPEKYRDAAQNGAIAIEKFVGEADEATLEAINNYREWAQKAADLKQQVQEVITTIRDLAIQKFDNAYEAGDVRATVEDSQTEKLQNAVDYDEERGLITSDEYYIAMMENSNKKIEYLTNAREAMQKELNAAVEAGQIERGSNEWYELLDQMYQIDAQIDEATIELEEFQNAINDLYWDNFDQLINRLDYLKNDTQSLIDLMANDDLVADPTKKTYEGGTVEYWTADDVKWTDEGIASLGLYAQQMEIAEYTARQYAEAIDDLEKDYKAGLYSENEYIEKLEELKNAQYDSIESYYDAQDAIVELNEARVDSIKEGIEKEIDAYEELIEKQKEQLDAEKDLYDFQKGVGEQQKNIADIERQLAALANDNSMSAIAKRKQLEAELAEAQYELQDTYYNRSVEDKQTALDKELEDFQVEKDAEIQKWDEYLTNVEALVAESLGIVQANADEIGATLTTKAEEYNLTISDAIMTPWKDGSLAVSDYQDTFDTAMSSTMDQLESLKNKWQEVIDKMAEVGEANVDAINKENEEYAKATKKEPEVSKPTTPDPEETKPQEKQITVGGKINANGAKIYTNSSGGGGSKQYFASDPIYTVLQEKNGYLLVRHHKAKSGVTGWFKKSDVKALAVGTKKLDKSGIVNIDELGEELVLRAQNGRLTYMEKGSGVVPADLTSNLMEWGKLDPTSMLEQNRPSMNVHPEIHNTEVNLSMTYGDILHIDEFHGDNPDDIAKIVAKQFEKHTKDLNNALRKFAR